MDNRVEHRADAETITKLHPQTLVASDAKEIRPESLKVVKEALRVTVFEVDTDKKPGYPSWDRVRTLGVLTIVMQCTMSAIPWGLHANYVPFVITGAGTLLSLSTGALQQWGHEKFAAYKTGAWSIALTRGNGSRHVMLILGRGHREDGGLDLEVMAGRTSRQAPFLLTRVGSVILTVLWTVLLVTVSGLKDDTWCKPFVSTPDWC